MNRLKKLQQYRSSPRQRSERGQGITEYAIILALVGLAIVLVVNIMRPTVANVFSRLVDDAPVAPPALLSFTPPPTNTPHPQVTLTVNIVGTGHVNAAPDKASYDFGETVTLTAVPDDPNWVFIGWSGAFTGFDNPVALTMDADLTITATFAEKLYTVTTTADHGSVTVSPPGLYGLGQQVTLTAFPDPDWAFAEWQGDLTGSENPGTLIITGDMAVTAVFDAHQLTTIVSGNGQIDKNPDKSAFSDGEVVTLTAVPDAGWFFSGWSGDVSGGGNPVNLTMNSDKTVTAVFTEIPTETFSLTINTSGNGTVNPVPDKASYNDGEVVTLTAVPDPGWTFTGWSGDLSGSLNPASLTMDADKTVTATFQPAAYVLDVTIVGNGSVTKTPDQATYSYGQVVTLLATADLGWQFDSWSGDLTGGATSTTITMDGNKNVTATFIPGPCSLPSPWQSGDVGSVATAGEACEESGLFTIAGSGADIWNQADEFHFMYQSFTGNGEIIARVMSQTDTNNWAKAGVMIRESLNANSKHAFAALTPANGVRLQYRSSTGGSSGDTSGGGASAPVWLKLERIGDVFRAYRSNDGTNWTEYASQTISMGQTVYFGLAVTSHNDGQLSTATFTNVNINPLSTMKMEALVVNNVSSGGWTNVNLSNSYTNMVAVCSVNYRNNNIPEVVRMANASGSSFQIRLQNPSNSTLTGERVHCLVMEEGAWTLPDGRSIEAQKYTSTVTDENNSWSGQAQSYLQSYTNPVVLGQVMTYNDPDWSVFWNRASNNRKDPPTSSSLITGKHVGEDSDNNRASETIGFIVIEAGNGTVNGTAYEADLGGDSVRGIDNSPPYTYNFNQSFSAVPQVILVTQAAMDGSDGSWAVFYGANPATTSSLDLAVDEDQIGGSERSHTSEQVGYLVFSSGLVLP